ncbi:hypothetical protein AAON49_12950 [Pseudotenacibaculum sp. MALMAid0570]|uniref:hypothetical protein n=1 Tax=Pseudotenacibaculum sp. MALMAid0570 TaxID=3143938 RepID=UPI0032DE976A
MPIVAILIGIGIFLFILLGIIISIRAKRKKKESELGIFHHPSNFKKHPVEWVQKPKKTDNSTTKKL